MGIGSRILTRNLKFSRFFPQHRSRRSWQQLFPSRKKEAHLADRTMPFSWEKHQPSSFFKQVRIADDRLGSSITWPSKSPREGGREKVALQARVAAGILIAKRTSERTPAVGEAKHLGKSMRGIHPISRRGNLGV